MDTERIVGAMEGLQTGLSQYYQYSEVTYSVKTNYLGGILRRVLDAGFRLEVVSRHELALVESLGAQPRQLLFNGPAKLADDLNYCHRHQIELNVDSLEELELAASIGSQENPFRLGIRVAATLNSGATSRFGLDFTDPTTLRQVRRIAAAGNVRIVGLHLHHSSRRDAQSYCDRIDLLQAVAQSLPEASIEYLDIGGGIASIPPPEIAARLPYQIDTHEHLAAVIGRHAAAKLGAHGPRLILEPGIGVLAGSMNYVTSLTAVKPRANGPIAVCDGSMFDVNPLRSAISPPCHLLPSQPGTANLIPIPLYGGTCMEIDLVGTITSTSLPTVGDLVVVTNIGAYSVSLAPEFIIPSAPVYALDSKQLIRNRQFLGNFPGAGE